ncbi:hypothetical protein OIO90_002063 [Microbotryomycetes sp. JL221]|nr:hypothetical protein OIO90_002063 [Microbotryomycetes sp. JL221]
MSSRLSSGPNSIARLDVPAMTGLVASGSNSPAAPTDLKRKRPTKKQARSVAESSEDGDDDDQDGRKRKRNRMALSCKECKRRKIKCDREMPNCGPCTRRGKTGECVYDIFASAGDSIMPPSIARTAEVEQLAARLAHIEAYLKTLPPNLASFAPLQPNIAINNTVAATTPTKYPNKQEETYSDTEDAAVNLENGVFGSRIGAKDSKAIHGKTAAPSAVASSQSRRFGAPPTELTKALTSIVSVEPMSEAYAKARLNIDFDASASEIEQARQEEMKRILRVLPPTEVLTYFVELYFGPVNWLFHTLHGPTFMTELDSFQALCDANRQLDVDPLFVSVLLMVLCIAADGASTARSPLSLDPRFSLATSPLQAYSRERLQAMSERFYSAAQRALVLGEWDTVPRIRTIQTIILITQYLQLCSPTRGQPSQLVTWLAVAIRIAQVLGLHQLGSNPEVTPPDDPALPPGKNSLKRETAKRLWAVLVYQDWLGASFRNRSYLISPRHYDTDDPLNLNDADLSGIDWKVNPAPTAVLTDSTPDRVRIATARQVRKVFDAVILPQDFTYETVLELDKGYRAILESLPDRWTMESSAEESEQPMFRFQRYFAVEGIHNRGYTQPKYRYSTDACLKSARAVIVSKHNVQHATIDIWYTYSHVMGATLVLFNDLFQAIDSDASGPELDAKRDTLNLAAEIFSQGHLVSAPSLQQVVEQGCKIIAGLFRAADSRRMARAARHLLSAGQPQEMDGGEEDDEIESFADVLQRISRSLNTQTAPHRGTPPPTRNIHSAQRAHAGPALASFALGSDRNSTFKTTPSASILPSSSLLPDGADFGNPWPFPSTMDGSNDDLSLSFFQELDFGVPDMGMFAATPGSTSGLWNLDQGGTAVASAGTMGQALRGPTTPLTLPATATFASDAPSASINAEVEPRWPGPGGGGQFSSLLDQVGGGW